MASCKPRASPDVPISTSQEGNKQQQGRNMKATLEIQATVLISRTQPQHLTLTI